MLFFLPGHVRNTTYKDQYLRVRCSERAPLKCHREHRWTARVEGRSTKLVRLPLHWALFLNYTKLQCSVKWLIRQPRARAESPTQRCVCATM